MQQQSLQHQQDRVQFPEQPVIGKKIHNIFIFVLMRKTQVIELKKLKRLYTYNIAEKENVCLCLCISIVVFFNTIVFLHTITIINVILYTVHKNYDIGTFFNTVLQLCFVVDL